MFQSSAYTYVCMYVPPSTPFTSFTYLPTYLLTFPYLFCLCMHVCTVHGTTIMYCMYTIIIVIIINQH